MKTQFDHKVHVVELSNLETMCKHVSETCHRYWIEKVTPNRVHIGYSNPDEYGNECPMFAVFPCYCCDYHDKNARAVVLKYLGVIHDNDNGEGWQSFEVLRDCPALWRSNPNTDDWKTKQEIVKGQPTL